MNLINKLYEVRNDMDMLAETLHKIITEDYYINNPNCKVDEVMEWFEDELEFLFEEVVQKLIGV